jgi:hypothetical protein
MFHPSGDITIWPPVYSTSKAPDQKPTPSSNAPELHYLETLRSRLLAAGWFLSGNKSKQHAIPAPLSKA